MVLIKCVGTAVFFLSCDRRIVYDCFESIGMELGGGCDFLARSKNSVFHSKKNTNKNGRVHEQRKETIRASDGPFSPRFIFTNS